MKVVISILLLSLTVLLTGCPGGSMNGKQAGYAMRDLDDEDGRIRQHSRNYKTFPNITHMVDSYVSPDNGCRHFRYSANPFDDAQAKSHGSAGGSSYYSTSLKNHSRPSKGCIPLSSISMQDARNAYKAHNLTFESDSSGSKKNAQEKAFGAAMMRIQQLNGGPLPAATWRGRDRYPIKCMHGISSSSQRETHIRIKMNRSTSVAQYAHEIAHLVGNQGGYSSYNAYMRGYGFCMVSGYADNNPSGLPSKRGNEQFAEVFAAFVTEPAIFLKNTKTPKACRRAYKFFKDVFFKKGDRVKECL